MYKKQLYKKENYEQAHYWRNAGILWRFLSTDAHKRWEIAEVKKGTGMDDMELASAI